MDIKTEASLITHFIFICFFIKNPKNRVINGNDIQFTIFTSDISLGFVKTLTYFETWLYFVVFIDADSESLEGEESKKLKNQSKAIRNRHLHPARKKKKKKCSVNSKRPKLSSACY